MLRKRVLLAGSLVLAGCFDQQGTGPPAGMDAGAACEDRDRDGFGVNCARGRDCDDHDAGVTNE